MEYEKKMSNDGFKGANQAFEVSKLTRPGNDVNTWSSVNRTVD
ncbi:hypothetical protein [Spirosoma sp. KNUC1025]